MQSVANNALSGSQWKLPTYYCRGPQAARVANRVTQAAWRTQATRRETLSGLTLLTSSLVGQNGSAVEGPAINVTNPDRPLGFENCVSEFTLSNGLHFIVLERHLAPVVSCHTYANVGAFVEDEGSTGLAHLLEHMAFKGTPRVGSRDWRAEAAMLAQVDEAFYTLREAQRAAGDGNMRSIRRLEEQFRQLQAAAGGLLVPNAYGSLLQSSGAVGLNASTSHDATRYYVSLPTNKLELWFALESERFQAPTFRSLYPEKEVVAEERRLRLENSPVGALTYEFSLESLGNNYRRPVIGYAEDVAAMGTQEVAAFFERYYHPHNLTICLVGDVSPGQVQALAEKYFGSWRAAAHAEDITISRQLLEEEPLPLPLQAASSGGGSRSSVANNSSSSSGIRSVSKEGGSRPWEFLRTSVAGPLVLMGYYRPTLNSRKGIALEVASDILAGGRSSRMVEQLLQQGRCLSASVSPGYPGNLHAGLALVSGVPVSGGSLEGLAKMLQQQLDEFMQGGPSAKELARVKKGSRSTLLSSLTSNSSMAATLAAYHATTGSWRGMLEELQTVEELQADEVMAAVREVYQESNRFTGLVSPVLTV